MKTLNNFLTEANNRMVLSCRLYPKAGIHTFMDCMRFITQQIIKKYNIIDGDGKKIDDAYKFFKKIKEDLIKKGCGCCKMLIDPFGDSQHNYDNSDHIYITFQDDDRNCCAHYCFYVNKQNHDFQATAIDIYNHSKFPDACHKYLMSKMLAITKKKYAGIAQNKKIKIELIYIRGYDRESVETLQGTICEIFYKFTELNDHLKYMNGCYYKFKDKQIEEAYKEWLNDYPGNIHLDIAVKNGSIID